MPPWVDGEYKGATTADPPVEAGRVPQPYLISDGSGTFRNGAQLVQKGPRPTMMFGPDGRRIKSEG